MSWARIDDQYARHPKILKAGPLAGWLHVASICYANQYLTDGFIPESVLETLADFRGIVISDAAGQTVVTPALIIAQLVAAHLWDRVEGGIQIHDFLEYNHSAAEIRAARSARSEAGKVGGQRSGVARAARSKAEPNAKQDGSKREASASSTPDAAVREAKPEANANQTRSTSEASASYFASGLLEAKPNPVPVLASASTDPSAIAPALVLSTETPQSAAPTAQPLSSGNPSPHVGDPNRPLIPMARLIELYEAHLGRRPSSEERTILEGADYAELKPTEAEFSAALDWIDDERSNGWHGSAAARVLDLVPLQRGNVLDASLRFRAYQTG